MQFSGRIVKHLLLVLSALTMLACGSSAGAKLAGTGTVVSSPSPQPSVPVATPTSTPTPTPTIEATAGLPLIVFSTASGGAARLAVEIESNDAERQRGLMGVTSLPADQGQLFIFQDIAPDQDVSIGFWMMDTLVPLSIAFISGDHHVQEIQDMQPQTLDVHSAQQPYRYAIEANQGWYARHGVAVGSTVDLSAALGR